MAITKISEPLRQSIGSVTTLKDGNQQSNAGNLQHSIYVQQRVQFFETQNELSCRQVTVDT